jgi:acyl carrier protein
MTRDDIRRIVIEALHEMMGSEDVAAINDDTDPNLDLGLDSHDGVDFACFLSRKLGFPIPERRNPFRDDPCQPYRQIGGIIDFVQEIVDQHEGVHHA